MLHALCFSLRIKSLCLGLCQWFTPSFTAPDFLSIFSHGSFQCNTHRHKQLAETMTCTQQTRANNGTFCSSPHQSSSWHLNARSHAMQGDGQGVHGRKQDQWVHSRKDGVFPHAGIFGLVTSCVTCLCHLVSFGLLPKLPFG